MEANFQQKVTIIRRLHAYLILYHSNLLCIQNFMLAHIFIYG